MKVKIGLFSLIGKIPLVGLLMSLWLTTGFAVTHVVQFGGSLGDVFSPKTFTAKVGDTVKWEGDFTFHDVQSTTIPSQATPWHPGSLGQSVFIYVLKVAGAYDYQCNTHVAKGMVGSFTVTASTAIVQPNSNAKQLDFQTRMLQGKNVVEFSLPEAAKVNVTLFTVLGKEIATKINGFASAGSHKVALGPLAKGFYFVKLTTGAVNEVKMLHIVQ
jgi:plastocyanin